MASRAKAPQLVVGSSLVFATVTESVLPSTPVVTVGLASSTGSAEARAGAASAAAATIAAPPNA
ncbi:hypothetical protein ACQ86I_23785 [Prescottella equi]